MLRLSQIPPPCLPIHDVNHFSFYNQALSSLTMLAQVMWEEEKQDTPVPVPREPKEEETE